MSLTATDGTHPRRTARPAPDRLATDGTDPRRTASALQRAQ